MVHVVHFILNNDQDKSRKERIASALGKIGPSVVLGASTTLIGIVPLYFASNEVFRVFFRMFLIIILFGVR